MSKLDLTLTEKVLPELNEMNKDLVDVNDAFLNHEHINDLKKMDIDLQDWLEVFEEDQVTVQGCR
ncbi:MAG: hypothetical protein KC427_04525 [Sulfurovum sp.]|uniref:hypothetical protein n=1 Tax=Sulfurovum sp. TaxID=1969726 RepID=UPI00286819F8|nr:hypothetical protein [Sulfurovum sp.]MCO4845265.1 hypothetical protein [Sulfurovum sp.]